MPGTVPPVADEREALLAFLDQQRQAVRIAAYGLTDEQARAVPSASELCLAGIVKHLAAVERTWAAVVRQEARPPSDPGDYDQGFGVGPDETLAALMDDYAAAGEETAALVGGIADLGFPVPVPRDAPWFPHDVTAWSLRWVLLHLIEETARHAGHADVVRQSLDGATAYPLMAAAEDWPPVPWLARWEPAS